MACSGMRKDLEIQVIIQYIIQGLYYWCHKSGCPRNAIVSLIIIITSEMNGICMAYANG